MNKENLDRHDRNEKSGEPFFPHFILKEAFVALLVVLIMYTIVIAFPVAPEKIADPGDTRYIPEPDWYFLFLYQGLKYFTGSLELIAVVVIPSLLLILLFLVPFLDRRPERAPLKRPAAIAAAAIFVVMVLFRTYQGAQPHPSERVLAAPVAYVGSERCAACHKENAEGWKETWHARTIQPIHEPGAILANFAENPPFPKSTAAWTFGGSHSQRFLEERNGVLYFLPGQWLVGANKWQPLEPEEASNCLGCHATAYDPDMNKYEAMGVTCESCHGPGSKHAASEDTTYITKTYSGEVCGQCHSKGTDLKHKTSFPVGYRPGETLVQVFEVVKPVDGVNTDDFYGNGIGRNHTRQYPVRLNSAHAKSLETLKEEENAQAACYNCHSADYRLASAEEKPAIEVLNDGITCVVCHTAHSTGTGEGLREPAETLYVSCHTAEDITAGQEVYHPQENMRLGQGGFGVEQGR